MNVRACGCLLASALALVSQAHANKDETKDETTGKRSIGLAEAQELAGARSFPVKRARARAEVGRDLASEAKWRLVPALAAQVGLTGVDGATQSSSSGAFDEASYTTASPWLRVAYGTNLVESYYGSVAAGERADALDEGVRVTTLGVRLAVTDQYFELVQAVANLEVAEKALADATEVLRITEVLEKQGQAKGDEVARARGGVAQAEQNRIRAGRAVNLASIRLATSLDLAVSIGLVPAEADLVAETSVALDDGVEALEKRALARRPEVAEAAERVSAVRADRMTAWSSLLAPAVEVYAQEGGLGEDFASLSERRSYGVLLTWTLSAAGIARVSTSTSRLDETRLESAEVRQRVTSEVALAYEDAERAAERLGPAGEALAAAEDAFRIASVRFRNGNAILVEVIAAQREVELARLGRVSAVVENNRAQARLALVTGE